MAGAHVDAGVDAIPHKIETILKHDGEIEELAGNFSTTIFCIWDAASITPLRWKAR